MRQLEPGGSVKRPLNSLVVALCVAPCYHFIYLYNMWYILIDIILIGYIYVIVYYCNAIL